MALQSQTIRGNSVPRSSGAYRGSRDVQKRLAGVGLLVLLVAGSAYWYFERADSAQRQTRSGAIAQPPAAPAITPSTAPTPAPMQPARDGAGRADAGAAAAPGVPAGGPTPVVVDMSDGRIGARREGIPTLPLAQAQTRPAPEAEPSKTPQDPASRSPTGQNATTPAEPSGGVRDPLTPPSTPASLSTTPSAGRTDTGGLPPELADLIRAGEQLNAQGKLLEARAALNRALLDRRVTPSAHAGLRATITDINQTLIFSPAMADNDPMAASYEVKSGDSLVRIARSQQTVTEPTLIARVNRLANPNALRVGQRLKLVRGPFHAVVDKSDFRMDVYAGPAPSGTPTSDGPEANWTFVRSFRVGLGEKGVTPIASFAVKDRSKLVNPFWVNPRTGEKFNADDPKNPIGERWIGLEGLSLRDQAFTGYGIHGTIEPDSIGREQSMGCVRMMQEDVELVYELLMPRVSIVKIVE